MTRVCADAGISPFVNATDNVTVIKREGAFEAVIAIEHEFLDGSMTAPFDCEDMRTGESFKQNEILALGKYEVRILKRKN